MAELVKLRCFNCALQSECLRKERKEKYEDAGWQTYCETGIKVWSGPKKGRRDERRR
jgi:hypothetical protein